MWIRKTGIMLVNILSIKIPYYFEGAVMFVGILRHRG